MFEIYICSKELIFRIYQEVKNSTTKTNNTIKNGLKIWIDTSERRHKWATSTQKMLHNPIFREIQIKTTRRCYLITVRMAIIKKTEVLSEISQIQKYRWHLFSLTGEKEKVDITEDQSGIEALETRKCSGKHSPKG
jgi:hypothetical protein